MCHHNASLVVVRDYIGSKLSNLANTKCLISKELDPDRTTVGARVGVRCCCGRREFADHVVAGTRRELELGAAVRGAVSSMFSLSAIASMIGLT